MAYKRIVFATDGSEFARQALGVAIALAKALRGRLFVVHAFESRIEGEIILAEAVAIAEGGGVKAEGELLDGAPGPAIVEFADRHDADVIVIGSAGRNQTQMFQIGNVAHKISHHAPCDVLLVRSSPGGGEPYKRVLVATDGSATADRAARKAFGLAEKLGASVELVFVGHPKTGELVLQDTVATMGEEIESSTRIVQGDQADKIIEVAETEGFGLVVVGNKGMTGAKRFLLGSVPQKVSEYAACDVLIARTVTQVVAEIDPGEGGIIVVAGEKVAAYRDDKGVLHGMSARCTHLGCTVKWNGAERTWDCPCHGSRFGPVGDVVNGPAAKPLPPVPL